MTLQDVQDLQERLTHFQANVAETILKSKNGEVSRLHMADAFEKWMDNYKILQENPIFQKMTFRIDDETPCWIITKKNPGYLWMSRVGIFLDQSKAKDFVNHQTCPDLYEIDKSDMSHFRGIPENSLRLDGFYLF